MSRARLALVALLSLALVVAAAGPTAIATAGTANEKTAPGPLVSPGNQTPNVLGVETERSGFGSPNLSVTKSLQMQQSSVTREFTRRTLERRLAAAPNETVRQRVLLNATARIGNRTDALRREAQSAKQAFRRGDLSAARYATRLGLVHSRATDLLALVRYVNGEAESTAVIERTRRLQSDLSLLVGGARSAAAAQVRGSETDHRFYAGVGGEDVVLAYMDGGTYVRDATRPTFYTPGQPGIPGLTEQLDHATTLYPWVFNHTAGSATLTSFAPYAYVVEVPHDQGHLVAYVGSSGDVYHEEQRLRLDRLPTDRDLVVTRNNTTLAIDRTYAGGPLYVNVTNATGAPLDAEITVANETVGRTGADGRLWTLSPAGEFVVGVQVGDVRLNTSVTATAPTAESESKS